MPIKIVVDSCCEVPLFWADYVKKAPLSIDLDNITFIDDDELNMSQYLGSMKNMKTFKTACPSTQTYLELYEGDKDVIVITLSDNLSGSYQSAHTARVMYYEKTHSNKKIHIINSKSASAGQTAILIKLLELCKSDLSTNEVIEQIELFANQHRILFMLQSLANLSIAGRVSPLIAKAASVLNIRCIMGRTDDGHIELHQKMIGDKRCLKELARQISILATDIAERTLCISHCESKERVDAFIKYLSEYMDIKKFKNILINHTGGLSSLYADFGGIIIAF